MRNLLGRLHARRLPELLRIADAWAVPVRGDSKGEVAGALYRAMTDPRTTRDLWERLGQSERAMIAAMADAPDAAPAPTLDDLAAQLGVSESDARETALHLYRIGILAREGDDEPLPIGAAPRLLLPREIALHVRRLHDEMAAGDLAQAPLRVLLELLDDAELEAAARTWGMRTVPGVVRRSDLTARMLRLVNDRNRVERVVRGRGRDAAAIWKVVRTASDPVAVAEVAQKTGLGGAETPRVSRLRAALSELEGALLVWHAYRDGTRWLFVPPEIRTPGEAPTTELPPLDEASVPREAPPWRHPDAVAWDLLTLLRVIGDRHAPAWEESERAPRWLGRAVNQRLWFRGDDAPPTGYLEVLRALGMAEGILAVDEEVRPPRVVIGPHAPAWRRQSFRAQTTRLRDRWLRLPRWVEGEPAQLVEVWGADWRGMRPRLLAALADPDVGWSSGAWVTIESLSRRIAACYPALLGPSFSAATARAGGEIGAGIDEREARTAALSDVVALELGGPFAWFGLTAILDAPGRPRAVTLTELGAALATRAPLPAEDDAGAGLPPLGIDESGEVTLRAPSPVRVWALSAFAEPVDLGAESHYRLTPGSVAHALAGGVERDQIVTFLERGSGAALPAGLAANLAAWARDARRVRMERAVVLTCDDPAERGNLLQRLGEAGWTTQPQGDLSVIVRLPLAGETAQPGTSAPEEELIRVLRGAGHAPVWTANVVEGAGGPPGAEPPAAQHALPDDEPSDRDGNP